MNDADTRLVIKRTFQAPVDKVYKAWTTPTLMQEWFAPGDMTVPSLEPMCVKVARIASRC